MKTSKMTEQQAAALVVDYLTDLGLDVYQEVSFGFAREVADIVAIRGREVWIVEVKSSWSLELLEQLRVHQRHGHAHRIFAAVPQSRTDRERQRLFRDCGFGSICIRKDHGEDWGRQTQVEAMAPRLTSHPIPETLALLDEGHKTHAKAGAPCAKGRWSPFRRTADALAEVVKKNPGICMKEAMKQIDHHYSSDSCARASMATWAKAGKVPGVKAVRQGKILALYPPDFVIQDQPKREDPLPDWAQPQLKTGA